MLDPFSLFIVILSVVILGLAKGGFGGVGTPVALPLMSVGLPAEIALGILLPLLMATDVISVTAHRKNMDFRTIGFALPGAIIGVMVGASLIAFTPEDLIKAAIGVLAIAFALMALTGRNPDISHWPRWVGSVFGAASGLTSTLAHAGGPPIHIYFLTKAYTPQVFVATASGFMAGVNILKVGPYFAIGTLNPTSLLWALYLAPVAILAALAGVWVSRVISKKAFKCGVNTLMIVAGLKLIWDSLT